MKNKFITIEGIEGSGKTTIKKFIFKLLQNNGIKNVICIREPGSTPICEKLRKLIKSDNKEIFHSKTEILIFYAARAQLLENIIKPALKNGYWVIGDRHDLSSQAYQGRNNLNTKINELIAFLKENILEGFVPDLTFYLDINPYIGIQRVFNRNKKIDRIEKNNINFFTEVRKKYLELSIFNEKIKIIDASKSIKEIEKLIKKNLKKWFIK